MLHHALGLLALLALLACAEPADPADEEVAVHVGMVAVDTHNVPVIVLEEDDGPRLLRIWIGVAEAHSIASQIEKRPAPRPNTHDLAKRVIQGLHGEVVRVVVNDLRRGTFYATLSLRDGGELIEIDARPSDAIAIALRTDAPIFVRAAVFDEAGEKEAGDAPGQPI